ncbi:hypothetical protein [Aequorivita marina]|uniref:hypothetical protein n=1 Tax=Aequorivita marina TaxID=3073654 RepID=UPI0028747D03|nr:hypothetical protein [Aequorivita sp. S2608]MDS1299094.1 hypothetical protein [Aequorivita sp. S2608]
MDLFERMERPTPRFFRHLRNIGLGMTAIGGTMIAEPILLPSIVIALAEYLIVAGAVASLVSQAVINDGYDDDYPPPSGMEAPGPNPLLDVNR